MLSLPFTPEQSQTTEQIQSNIRHLRNVLTVIQAEYESLAGCILAVGSDSLNIIAPLDNLEFLATEVPAIAYETFMELGLKLVKIIVGCKIIATYEA